VFRRRRSADVGQDWPAELEDGQELADDEFDDEAYDEPAQDEWPAEPPRAAGGPWDAGEPFPARDRVDLGSLQDILTSSSLAAAQPDQWWLATTGGGPSAAVPASLAGDLPPGSDITSAAGVAAGLLSDPLSTVPQQALLVVAIAAAILAITGFCVSIAAGVRQRRAENALLAALGVPPRAAAGQLCLEKLMLSLPSAVAGLILGVVLAELLVPAITLTSSATTPVPPVIIQFGWAQILPLALAVAVLPVLAAALTVARRPDAAAALRAAEAA